MAKEPLAHIRFSEGIFVQPGYQIKIGSVLPFLKVGNMAETLYCKGFKDFKLRCPTDPQMHCSS
jgi:hypothetical protein